MGNESEKVSAMVPTVLVGELARLAGEHDRSVSAEIRAAVRAYVVRSESSGDASGLTEFSPGVAGRTAAAVQGLRHPEEEEQ